MLKAGTADTFSLSVYDINVLLTCPVWTVVIRVSGIRQVLGFIYLCKNAEVSPPR